MEDEARPSKGNRTLGLSSPAFAAGGRMPETHVRRGGNASPPLDWTGSPDGTRTFALLCEDPDAPGPEPFVHWILFNIPSRVRELPLTTLPEGISKGAGPRAIPGALQGTNDFGDIGYDGPEPPKGHGTHHYHFKLHALDAPLDLPGGVRRADFLRAIEGHVLSTGEIVATYSR